jgi:hypothetical protein
LTVFYDDFERANGAPGNGWTALTGSATIAGGYLTSGLQGILYNSSLSGAGRNEATIESAYADSSSLGTAVAIKLLSSPGGGYYGYLVFSSPNYVLTLSKGYPGAFTVLASTSLGTTQPFSWNLNIVYDAGHITLTYNGVTSVAADDVVYSGGTYMGLYVTSHSRVAWFKGQDTSTAATFDITEAAFGNYGSPGPLHGTGTNTAWTVGTPGSPTFTVDHGLITAQEVVSTTTVAFTYDPGSFLGMVTFTDPSTGATDTVLVTSDPRVVNPPGAGDTWSPYKALVDTTGTVNDPNTLLTDQSAFIPASSFDFGSAGPWPVTDINLLVGLQEMYAAIVAQQKVIPPTVPNNIDVLKWLSGGVNANFTNVDAPTQRSIKADLASLMGDLGLSLDDLWNEITDIENTQLPQIRTDLGIRDQATWTSLLDVLLAMWGPGRVTLAALAAALAELRGTGGYDLTDLWNAITQITMNVDLAPILDELYAIRGNTTTTLKGIEDRLKTLQGVVDTTAAAVDGIRGPALNNLQDILDAIADLKASIPGMFPSLRLPPVWPGIEHVTFGAPLDLATTDEVGGPIHGVAVHITGVEQGTGQAKYAGHTAYKKAGSLSFIAENGRFEAYQQLGFTEAIYMPLHLQVASGCRLHKSKLLQGTITPWSITS